MQNAHYPIKLYRMSIPTRTSVKVLLLSEDEELLLLQADDPKTTSVDGVYNGRFWFPVGGEIEPSESIEETALREIFEETGLTRRDVELGPIVWKGEFDLVLSGKPTHLKQSFIVTKAKKKKISLAHLTPEEQAVVKKAAWFSLEKIQNSREVIFPVVLPQYLPDILAGIYPKEPLEIDLGKQPAPL